MKQSRFWLLVERELKSTILSRRFPAVFGISSILIVLSMLLGVGQYRAALDRLQTQEHRLMQEMEEADHWYSFKNEVSRTPDPMMVLIAGVDYDVGRQATVSIVGEPSLEDSAYSDDPLFALFRFFDFSFVVQVVLSLMAILFAYDAISGERESGTLKLVMANPVARPTFVLSKFVGLWVGLIVPLILAILIAVLVVMLLGVGFSGPDWLRFAGLLVVSLLYVTVFIAIGLFVSATTRRSSISFLVLLSIWAATVLIIPRLSTVVAGQVVDTMTIAEMEGKRSRFTYERFRTLSRESYEIWKQRSSETEGMSRQERQEYYERNKAKFAEQEEELRNEAFDDIAEYVQTLREQRRNQTTVMEGLALNLARLSPTSAYQLASMELAGTGLQTKERYSELLRIYQKAYATFLNDKTGPSVWVNGEPPKPSWSELPKFSPSRPSLQEYVAAALPDLGLLAIYTLLAFAGAYVAFLRYDVR